MRATALQEAVASVFDIDQVARPMVAACGYREVALPDAPPAQFAAWQVPPGCTRIEQRLLVPGDGDAAPGAMRLVRFHGVDQRVMRSSQRSWDTGGIFDVDMFSADVDRVYRDLQRHGWTAMGEPVDYSEAGYSVRQVVALGPSGVVLAIIQRYVPPVEGLDPGGNLGPIFNSTQMVADFDGALAFYRDTLGWNVRLRFDITDQAEPGADVLGLPLPQAETAYRELAMVNPPGLDTGAVELIRNRAMRGRRCDADCVAPHVGILCLRIAMDDAPAYAATLRARGVVLRTEPSRLEIAPHGPVDLFAVRAPEGAIIEFFSLSPPA